MEILKKKKKEEKVWKQAQRKVKMPREPTASYEGILREY